MFLIVVGLGTTWIMLVLFSKGIILSFVPDLSVTRDVDLSLDFICFNKTGFDWYLTVIPMNISNMIL